MTEEVKEYLPKTFEGGLIPETGLIKDLPFEMYAAEPAINSGMLTMFCRGKTPAHIKAKYIDKRVAFDSEDLDFGRKAHAIILEPKRFQARHVVMPKFTGKTVDGRDSDKSKEAKEKRAAWLADLPPDVFVVTEEEAVDLTGMVNELLRNDIVKNVLSRGASEISGFWIDKETGVRCKFRADFINFAKRALCDYKTARESRHDEFRDSFERLFYSVQLFHYLQGCQAMNLPVDDILVVAQEKIYPYLAQVFFLSSSYLDDAKERWRSALNQLAQCQKSGIWPGFPNRITELVPSNRLQFKEVL